MPAALAQSGYKTPGWGPAMGLGRCCAPLWTVGESAGHQGDPHPPTDAMTSPKKLENKFWHDFCAKRLCRVVLSFFRGDSMKPSSGPTSLVPTPTWSPNGLCSSYHIPGFACPLFLSFSCPSSVVFQSSVHRIPSRALVLKVDLLCLSLSVRRRTLALSQPTFPPTH